jgi:hypothetical protein
MLLSCNDFLNIIPDNIPTVDHAFNIRNQALKYLATCYSYMPENGNLDADPAMTGGDEIWANSPYANTNLSFNHELCKISLGGLQNKNAPIGDKWEHYYDALRDCNIFLENIDRVPDMEDWEKAQLKSEVLVLKAYYHYNLVLMYGPISLVRKNIDIKADAKEYNLPREHVDTCFNYIVSLIDQAIPFLSEEVQNETTDLGRITSPIAYSIKAKVLVTAASPLFNKDGNEFAQLKNNDGTSLFSSTFSSVKWDSARSACKTAIQACNKNILYHYTDDYQLGNLPPEIMTQMNIRNSMCQKWNNEIIWANTNSVSSYTTQRIATAIVDPVFLSNYNIKSEICAPQKIVRELFYTKNGIPINEDVDWVGVDLNELKGVTAKDMLFLKQGAVTARVNFDREPRFYADLGFDNGIWYGQGLEDPTKDLFYLAMKQGEANNSNAVTGYLIKKMVHFKSKLGPGQLDYTVTSYPWPIIRLADLYLLYAESLNETLATPTQEVWDYVNLVRTRAGLKSVEESWSTYSTNKNKYQNKTGMREIIQQERLIELAFEGQRFWDLKRWRKCEAEMNKTIIGWYKQGTTAETYYSPTVIWSPVFEFRDYFWPIKDTQIKINTNLVQNLQW